jgi:hypothetical protein
MKNAFRVVSFWADGWRQVEGFYDSLKDAEQAIQDYEQSPAIDYRGCRVFQDFRTV